MSKSTTTSENTNGEARATEHLARKAHDTIDSAAKVSAEAEAKIREQADATADKLRDTEQKAREMAERSASEVSGYIRENPLMSAGLAFVAGVFVSSLMRR